MRAGRSASNEVRRALSHWEPVEFGVVEQFSGLEVNSSNFRVATNRGSWLVKRVPDGVEPELAVGLQLWEWLAGTGYEVPVPIATSGGRLTRREGTHAWSVTQFVPGAFFHGSAELEATARAIARIHVALQSPPSSVRLSNRWDYQFDDGDELLRAASREKTAWTAEFGALTAQRLAKFANSSAISRANETRDGWCHDEQVSHGDLHPHNVLVDEDRPVAVVDVESLVVIPVLIAYAFARFKLVRQAVSAEALELPAAVLRAQELSLKFRRAVESEDQRKWPETMWRQAAEVELMRRIFVILRSYYVEGDARWNRVLEMQLRGLEEIALMDPGE